MMSVPRRAVSEGDKKRKQAHILDVTERLVCDADFSDITMATIASEAGIAKGTLFLYFQTKEDVFLSLIERKFEQWRDRFSDRMLQLSKQPVAGIYTRIPEFADELYASISDRVFIKLLAILDDTLEQNIDFDRAVSHKKLIKDIMQDLGASIEALFPLLQAGDGTMLLNQFLILFIGSYKICHPSEILRRVTREPGLEQFDRDFSTTLRNMIVCHMTGFFAIRVNQNHED